MEPLPTAVLGAIVIAAVVPLVRLSPIRALWALSPPQFVVATATFAATLALSPRIQEGVLIGVGLSLLVFLWRMLQLELDITVDGEEMRIRPRGVLWFATAQKLEDALVSALAQEPHVQQLRVDLSGVSRVDTTSALAIRALLAHARSGGLDAEIDNAPANSYALRKALLSSERELQLS
jgi:SulP family sulfate permease